MSAANWQRWIPDADLRGILGSGRLGGIRVVAINEVQRLLEDGPREDGLYGKESQRHKYLAFDPIDMQWVAIDNTEGQAFTEEFPQWERAVAYLHGDGIGDDYRPECLIDVFDAPRGIGKPAREAVFVLKPAKE